MPFYDYHCETCGKDFELFHPMNKNPEKPSECDRQDCCLRQKIKACAFHLKGTGWYKSVTNKKESNN